ncbi:hypothetical protein VNO77_19190 [Canavalia gladiata]|uniref:Uncharacterized protein n=1 Tax=Canavalia gladiata TaxID=3824 RepID=A0AAN9LQI9_CANGL
MRVAASTYHVQRVSQETIFHDASLTISLRLIVKGIGLMERSLHYTREDHINQKVSNVKTEALFHDEQVGDPAPRLLLVSKEYAINAGREHYIKKDSSNSITLGSPLKDEDASLWTRPYVHSHPILSHPI